MSLALRSGFSRIPVDRRGQRRRPRRGLPQGHRSAAPTSTATASRSRPSSRSCARPSSSPRASRSTSCCARCRPSRPTSRSSSTSTAAPPGSSPSRTCSRRSSARSPTSTTSRAPLVEQLPDGALRVSARLHVDELAELLGVELEDEDVDTVGGLLAKHLGRVPIPGAQVCVARGRADRREHPGPAQPDRHRARAPGRRRAGPTPPEPPSHGRRRAMADAEPAGR